VSEANVEVVRRAIAAGFVSHPPDVETLCEVLDPDHLLTSNWGVETAEHHGVQGLLDAIAEMAAAWDPWEQEVERIIDAGQDCVVGLLRLNAQGRESGVPVQFPWAMVVTLRGGRMATSRVFLDQGQALKAVDLEE
jgi:ketosteroid isomerase-like protein